jgi:hypothetical protein
VKARKKRDERLGKLAFFIPLIVIISLVVYGYFQVNAPGTIKVEALAFDKYAPVGDQNTTLSVTANVDGTTETTPFSVSVSAGTYDVTFGSNQWYVTATPHTVTLGGHQTAFAVGTYNVVAKVITLTQAGFNATSVSALHGVTPVIWINDLNKTVSIGVLPYGNQVLEPGQNFTAIYQNTGSFEYASPVGGSSSSSGTVTVV